MQHDAYMKVAWLSDTDRHRGVRSVPENTGCISDGGDPLLARPEEVMV